MSHFDNPHPLSQSVTQGMTPHPLERDVIIEWPLWSLCSYYFSCVNFSDWYSRTASADCHKITCNCSRSSCLQQCQFWHFLLNNLAKYIRNGSLLTNRWYQINCATTDGVNLCMHASCLLCTIASRCMKVLILLGRILKIIVYLKSYTCLFCLHGMCSFTKFHCHYAAAVRIM